MPEIYRLLQGFERFRKENFEPNREFFKRLAKGQAPRTMVVSCSDSRVDPAIITHSLPGELFVVRNVANLVPPCQSANTYRGTSAALEYAVCYLHVHNIIVMGHAHCGGIKAIIDGHDKYKLGEGFIAPWIEMAAPARDRVLEHWPNADKAFQERAIEMASILISLDNLMSFPFVKQRIESGQLRLFGWYFNLDLCELLQYDPEQGRFGDLEFAWVRPHLHDGPAAHAHTHDAAHVEY